MADWMAIKTEYVTGTISQRKLAEKYGVPPSSLNRRAKAEQWDEERGTLRDKTGQKTVEKVSDSLSDTAAIKARLDRKFWGLIEQAAEELTRAGPINPADLRRIVQCYVDMMGLPDARADTAKSNLLELLQNTPETDLTGITEVEK